MLIEPESLNRKQETCFFVVCWSASNFRRKVLKNLATCPLFFRIINLEGKEAELCCAYNCAAVSNFL